jgi:hypothetical protein
VYDYAAGEIDWLAHGLETEGETAGALTAGRLARDDVVTCRLDERAGEVRERVDASPYGFGLVTSAGGVLLGRLGRSALDGDPAARTEEVMEAGPATVRPTHRRPGWRGSWPHATSGALSSPRPLASWSGSHAAANWRQR